MRSFWNVAFKIAFSTPLKRRWLDEPHRSLATRIEHAMQEAYEKGRADEKHLTNVINGGT